jgi:hypothetical protein
MVSRATDEQHSDNVLMEISKMTTGIQKEPLLVRCVDRDEARLPDFFLPEAVGVIVAEPEFMRAIELPLWSDYPLGWSMTDEVRGQSHDCNLEVTKLGEYWFVGRKGKDHEISETVVEAFGAAPICTRTPRDAMLLAQHSHPEVRLPIGAHWLKFK